LSDKYIFTLIETSPNIKQFKKEALLLELEGKEADCFTLFPAYIQYIEDIEDRSCILQYNNNS
jgi:hypothetical protein